LQYHVVTNKMVHSTARQELLNTTSNTDRPTRDMLTFIKPMARVQTAIVIETQEEKRQRKSLALERQRERTVEQRTIVQHMDDLINRVIILIAVDFVEKEKRPIDIDRLFVKRACQRRRNKNYAVRCASSQTNRAERR
jgi:hypothetical protein